MSKQRIKEVKIMPDFSSTGIWNSNSSGGVMIEYEDLNLPSDLIKEFKTWIDFYEASFKKDYSTFKKSRSEKMNKMGLDLAQKFQKLFPKIKTIYYGEDERGLFKMCLTTEKKNYVI